MDIETGYPIYYYYSYAYNRIDSYWVHGKTVVMASQTILYKTDLLFSPTTTTNLIRYTSETLTTQKEKIRRTCRRPMVTILFFWIFTGQRRWIIHGRADYLVACIPALVVPASPLSCWGWPVCCLPCWPWPPKRTASPLYPSPSAGTWFDSISNRRGITTTGAEGLDLKLPAASNMSVIVLDACNV